MSRHAMVTAVTAGAIAAAVSAIPGIVHVVRSGEPWWQAVQLIATLVGFEAPVAFGLSAFLVGGAIHVVLSLSYALVFGLAGRRIATRWLVPAGLAFGFGIYLLNFEVAGRLGWFDAVLSGTDHRVELLAHVVFGATIGLVFHTARSRSQR